MLPLTVVLRHRLAAGGSGWQFEVPLSVGPGPLPAVALELGEPWDGVPGLGREDEVAGSVAGLWALSLTDSHSEAPLVLVHSEVAGWDSLSRLQAGWTRYFSGRGPFCRRERGRRMAPRTHSAPRPPALPWGEGQESTHGPPPAAPPLQVGAGLQKTGPEANSSLRQGGIWGVNFCRCSVV